MRWPTQRSLRRVRRRMAINVAFRSREVGLVRWARRTAERQYYKRVLKRDQTMQLPTGEWITLPISDRFASKAFITGADVDWGSGEPVCFHAALPGRVPGCGRAHRLLHPVHAAAVLEVFSFQPDRWRACCWSRTSREGATFKWYAAPWERHRGGRGSRWSAIRSFAPGARVGLSRRSHCRGRGDDRWVCARPQAGGGRDQDRRRVARYPLCSRAR